MFTMRIEGGDELARNLNALSSRISRRLLTEALLEGGEPLRLAISRLAPREPGAPDLADNINIGAVRRKAGADEREASVGIGVSKGFYYDYFLEYGTVRMGAQPFYRPAFDAGVQTSLGIVGQALWRELAGRGFGRSVSAPSLPMAPGGGGLL